MNRQQSLQFCFQQTSHLSPALFPDADTAYLFHQQQYTLPPFTSLVNYFSFGRDLLLLVYQSMFWTHLTQSSYILIPPDPGEAHHN